MRIPVHIFAAILISFLASLSLPAADTLLVNHSSNWRYRKGTNEPPADWHTVADASLDANWLTGPGGFGYGDGDDETILSDMQGNYTTVYTRQTFAVLEPVDTNARLRLEVDYDDGYVAYLDGEEIARSSNVASVPHPHNVEISDHAASVEGGSVHVTYLDPVGNRLAVGSHILAVQGINGDAGSSDATLIADLWLEESTTVETSNSVSGIIDSDTTWYASNLAYTVTGDLTLAGGATLTIEPGVKVQFNQGVGLTVNGRLLADGTQENPIFFTRSPDAATWERILFIQAEDSRLRHCVIEYSRCAGDHKIYYAHYQQPDCNTTNTAPRNYFQAVVAVASHVDFDYCLFRNLPDGSSTAEGDAIAIISDDLYHPGEASAQIRNCQFIGIGQGVHTRYSYVLVEHCYFTDHHGDNDDVDLYGESIPPPLILNNVMVNSKDDMINPTRCSAILIGNIIGGSTDGGVVLRDRCDPVMINNFIFSIPSGGISVQNTCDALLLNNTIVNCGQGINFRNHTGRLGPDYCLTPGSGRAAITNCLIWNCSTSIRFENAGSYAAIDHSVIPGGQGGISSSGSTLIWGDGNIASNPLFANYGTNNYYLTGDSPSIDAGISAGGAITITNLYGVIASFSLRVTNDIDGTPRALDGNDDHTAAFDLGAYEFLLPNADSNGDGVPDGWYLNYGLNPVDTNSASGNPDNDPHTTGQEYAADTDPTNALSYFRIGSISNGPPVNLSFQSSAARFYSLFSATNFPGESGANTSWEAVPGQEDQPGNGAQKTLADPHGGPNKFYRVGVRPE